jgi:NAD(P)-dependent dehydrogenase (short-subunit alcohol dehydrogenase family)
VVNSVGVLAMGPPEAMPLEAWQRVLDLNVLSIARSNLVFLPLLIAQGRGHVVNMGLPRVRLTSLSWSGAPREGCSDAEEVSAGVQA